MNILGNSIYIFGGEFVAKMLQADYLDEVWRFDLLLSKFRQVKTKVRIEGRIHHAACTYGNSYLMVSGGQDSMGHTMNDLHVLMLSRDL